MGYEPEIWDITNDAITTRLLLGILKTYWVHLYRKDSYDLLDRWFRACLIMCFQTALFLSTTFQKKKKKKKKDKLSAFLNWELIKLGVKKKVR